VFGVWHRPRRRPENWAAIRSSVQELKDTIEGATAYNQYRAPVLLCVAAAALCEFLSGLCAPCLCSSCTCYSLCSFLFGANIAYLRFVLIPTLAGDTGVLHEYSRELERKERLAETQDTTIIPGRRGFTALRPCLLV
jgi:hypothetical protein